MSEYQANGAGPRTNGNGTGHRASGNGAGLRPTERTPEDGSSNPVIGVLEWFRPGEHDRVERVLAYLKAIGVRHLRTGVSWADWYTQCGQIWYNWLFPRLAREVEILPCFVYTPPSLGIVPKTSSPPRAPEQYAHWLDLVITRFGQHFEWMELWNEPNGMREWDEKLDPGWWIFSNMVGAAAHWAKQRGKKTLLGGMSPIDPHWLRLMFERGVMQYIDAVGVHGFPVTFEFWWEGWENNLSGVRQLLQEWESPAEIWITETGYSTFRHDERRQLAMFLDALEAPAERIYWYAAQDLHPDLPTVDGFHSDEREYHFGLRKADGTPKLLHRIWASRGLSGVQEARWLTRPAYFPSPEKRPVLITGGAGFIGTNLAHRIALGGRPVILYDNLSRPGVEQNVEWLREQHGDAIQIEVADVRDVHTLRPAVAAADQVFHFAAQVAVTTSLDNPIHDFEVNARGTLNVLEAIRSCDTPPSLVFTSTNKVYGGLEDIELHLSEDRYEPLDPTVRRKGVSEERPLDFHSPYGCSKGTADQYVRDYARIYDIPTVVFRMSCIYGLHQFGTEDQGWVAHFLIRALDRKPITLYGDGMQVRDVLFIDDLVDAFLLAQANMTAFAGQAFNIGGGADKTISLLELLEMIETLTGRAPVFEFEEWRPGDQRYYVSDTSKFQQAAGWSPKVSPRQGVRQLFDWLRSTREMTLDDRSGIHHCRVRRATKGVRSLRPAKEAALAR